MSRYTQHRKWQIEPGFGLSAAAGPLGLTISDFSLVGDRTERLCLDFAGAGPSFGFRFNMRGEVIEEAASANLGLVPNLNVGTQVLFSGPTRAGSDFDGMGYILDFSAGAGAGAGVQVLLFNLAVSPFVLVHAAELAWQHLNGHLNSLTELRRVAPAIALTANALNITGINWGATAYHGYWQSGELSSSTRTGVGFPPTHRTTSYHP